jgi:hypothetical protein
MPDRRVVEVASYPKKQAKRGMLNSTLAPGCPG